MSKQLPMISKIAMTKSKPCLWNPLLLLVLCLMGGVCFGNRARAQQMQMPTMTPGSMQMPGDPPPRPGAGRASQISQMRIPGADGPRRAFWEQRIKALNTQRQKKLVSDTNKLLKLTARLNAEVGTEQAGSFTPQQLRMLARIEKLAKSVKEKMSTPIQLPSFRNNFPFGIAPSRIP